MFSLLRNRLGIPGVISVIALVFAMMGGAYAASNDGSGKANASAKGKRGPKGPKGAKGATGPTGPAGPAGAAGSQGSAGANGKDGANGAAGAKGATGATGPTGAPWPAGGTLPVGATETGTWAWLGEAAGGSAVGVVPLSFTIPLSSEIDAANVHFMLKEEAATAGCTGGTPANPKADSGHLCVYTTSGVLTEAPGFLKPGSNQPGASKSGAILAGGVFETSAFYFGTWAVTG